MTGKITGPLREQSDWAQNDEYRLGFIKNKPFYDNRKTAPLTIEWDGEIGGRETMDFVGTTFVKMMNEPPSYEELSAATFHVDCTEGFEEEFSNLAVMDGREQGYPFIGVSVNSTGAALCLCFPEDCTLEGVSYKKGLYLAKQEFTESGYVFAFIDTIHFPSVTTGELKTIDPKYLPSGGGGGLPVVEVKDLDLVLGGLRTEGADALKNAILNGTPFILKGTYKALNDTGESMSHDDLPDATSETVVSVYSIDGVKFCYLTALTANMMEWKYIAVVEDGEMFIEKVTN